MENADTYRDKVAVLTQYGKAALIEIHDPVFLEKFSLVVPEKVDWYTPAWTPGKPTLGLYTLFDEKTADKEFVAYWANLMRAIGVQYAKNHLPQILRACHSFVETVNNKKSQINYKSAIKHTFFGLMAKIMFGENFFRDVETITHYSQKGKWTTKTIQEVFEHFLSDTVIPSTKLIYLLFGFFYKLPWTS